ncbi:MAG: porin [Comamonas sp.]
MQKKIVALAATFMCAGAMPAFAQAAGDSKVELWGIVDAAVRHTTNQGANRDSKTELVGGGMSQSRWGIKVQEDLGAGSRAFVELENRFNADTGITTPDNTPFFQLAFVGLQGPWGRLSMGRQFNVLFDVVTSTYASFPYSPYMDANKPELGMAAGARNNNMLKYTLATADRKWVAGLQYSFAEGNKTADAEQAAIALGDVYQDPRLGGRVLTDPLVPLYAVRSAIDGLASGFLSGASNPNLAQYQTQVGSLQNSVSSVARGAYKTAGGFLRYSENGISVGGGYLKTYLPGGTDLDAWTLGGSYRKDKLYANLGYGVNKIKIPNFSGSTVSDYLRYTARSLIDRGMINNMWQGQTNGGFQAGDANKRQMYKVGFGYQITPQINAGLHYYHAKQSGSVGGASNGKANIVIGALDYAFSKRTDAYFAIDNTRVSGGEDVYIDAASKARSRTGVTVGLRHRF